MSKALSPLGDWSITVGITDCLKSGTALMVVTPAMISRICDTIYAMTPRGGPPHENGGERKHETVFPGFREMSERRRALTDSLVARRTEMGLSQTQVAARMGTSQSAVARLESGDADVRFSTLERYVAALGERLDWELSGNEIHASSERGNEKERYGKKR
jgi:ribosome-binding protein aMBF1 (putative translation factor)